MRYVNVAETRKVTKEMDRTLLDHLIAQSKIPPNERVTVPDMHAVRP